MKVNLSLEEFQKLFSLGTFLTLRNFSHDILSLFERTYICESVFSARNLIKLKLKSRKGQSIIRIVHQINHPAGFSIKIEKRTCRKTMI